MTTLAAALNADRFKRTQAACQHHFLSASGSTHTVVRCAYCDLVRWNTLPHPWRIPFRRP